MEWPQDSSINMSLLPLPIFIILPFWRSYFAMTWASNWFLSIICYKSEFWERRSNAFCRRNLLFLHLWCCIFSSIIVNSWKASFECRTENLGSSTLIHNFFSLVFGSPWRNEIGWFLFCFDERTHLILSALVLRLDDRNMNQDR